jgi:hypothetical protein
MTHFVVSGQSQNKVKLKNTTNGTAQNYFFYNYWHILVGDRTKNDHPEIPGWRVLGCTCRGGHLSHFGGRAKISGYKIGRIRKKYKRDSIEIFSNTCLKIANFWWQYNDYVHDLLTYTYIFLLKPIFYDIWFICNCILVTRYMMFIYLSSEQLSAIIGVWQGEQLAISRSRAHIAIVSFRLHRMYTQLPNPLYIRPWIFAHKIIITANFLS